MDIAGDYLELNNPNKYGRYKILLYTLSLNIYLFLRRYYLNTKFLNIKNLYFWNLFFSKCIFYHFFQTLKVMCDLKS